MNANGLAVVLTGALALLPASRVSGEELEAPEGAPAPSMQFGGRYAGTAFGHENSQAAIELELSQDADSVMGTGFLHDGLRVNVGGVCGGNHTISARQIPEVSGRQVEPNRLRAEFTINVDAGPRNIDVDIEIDATLSEDGNVLYAELRGDTPWPCRDVRMRAELARQ